MKINYRTAVTVLLAAALLISALMMTGIFEKSGIALIKSTQEQEIDVYLVGEVNNPGIYRIMKGSILNDLIEQAGGLRDSVDAEAVNLVYKIDKNMMIRIKENGMSRLDDDAGIGTYDEAYAEVMVNINTAGMEELCKVPGIGETTALLIIEYRNKNGNFTCIEDIMQVAGIKMAKFESMKYFICVNGTDK